MTIPKESRNKPEGSHLGLKEDKSFDKLTNNQHSRMAKRQAILVYSAQ